MTNHHPETIGDLDVLVVAAAPRAIGAALARLDEVRPVYAHGPTKVLVRLEAGIDADLRVVAPASAGAALRYFTGSKAHNVALRFPSATCWPGSRGTRTTTGGPHEPRRHAPRRRARAPAQHDALGADDARHRDRRGCGHRDE